MTRPERAFVRRRHLLWIATALLALTGFGILIWQRIDNETVRGDQLAEEANLRGNAVSTLATDVRKLRSQLQAKGETPVAPDPTKAISDLPDRAEVPVPIPGPPGPKGDKGDKGDTGAAAPTITPSPGPSGAPGVAGADSTVPGPQGPAGPPGADSTVPGPAGPAGSAGPAGEQGPRGEQGPAPSGWTYTDPTGTTYECAPDSTGSTHYTCRTTSTPATPSSQRRGLLGASMLAMSAVYRRL
ncbi:collagen-like protein [Streptomyces sp. NPDC057580]|uniref:collagen-like triple helix repeat-containing protein n=1 Tax=Streptomyces sp. NPDC057580 TaxID=3346173 RepID=UPI003679540E